MQFPDFSDQFDSEIQPPSDDDWSFQMQSTSAKPSLKSSNMLLSLSNNLMAYENSFKKNHSKNNQINLAGTSSEIKRSKLKRKLKFSQGLEEMVKSHEQLERDKQNKIQRMNFEEAKLNDSDESGSNLIKFEKMFPIMKDFNSLNESILPFKVNLNKVSHKRILASMVFKQFSLQHIQTIQSQKPQSKAEDRKQMIEDGNNLIETQILPIKRRIYSLDVRQKENLRKRTFKTDSNLVKNNIFILQNQDKLQGNMTAVRNRAKRTNSVRKPSNIICQKSIEQIRSNYSRPSSNFTYQEKEKLQAENEYEKNKLKLNSKQGKPNKQWDYFSDSRFFSHYTNPLKREALCELKIIQRNDRRCK